MTFHGIIIRLALAGALACSSASPDGGAAKDAGKRTGVDHTGGDAPADTAAGGSDSGANPPPTSAPNASGSDAAGASGSETAFEPAIAPTPVSAAYLTAYEAPANAYDTDAGVVAVFAVIRDAKTGNALPKTIVVDEAVATFNDKTTVAGVIDTAPEHLYHAVFKVPKAQYIRKAKLSRVRGVLRLASKQITAPVQTGVVQSGDPQPTDAPPETTIPGDTAAPPTTAPPTTQAPPGVELAAGHCTFAGVPAVAGDDTTLLQAVSGAVGGNPASVDLSGGVTRMSLSATPLDLTQLVTIDAARKGYAAPFTVPAGKVYHIRKIHYRACVGWDSNGDGPFVLAVKGTTVVTRAEDRNNPAQIVKGAANVDILLAPGEEDQVILTVSNSSEAEMQLDGTLE